MTDWSTDEAKRAALIAEIVADMPEQMQPGDVTVDMLAESLGITHSRAMYQLEKMERDGKLVAVRAVVPGARVPMKVWRKAADRIRPDAAAAGAVGCVEKR